MASRITTGIGFDPSRTFKYSSTYASDSTQPMYRVGDLEEDFDPTFGLRRFRFVRNTAGATVAANTIAVYKSGSGIEILTATTSTLNATEVAGVPIVAIPDGYFGWVQVYGCATVTADSTGFSANVPIGASSATAGTFMTSPNTTAGVRGIIAHSLAAIAANATGTVRLLIPS